jgi:hypothetical protein
MTTTTTQLTIGNVVLLTAISEWDGDKRMDTDIRFGDQSLCWVSGEDYEKFIAELQTLINTYRI